MNTRQLPLFGVRRAKRACFFSLHAHPQGESAKFSAYTPKAVLYFAEKHGLPVVDRPEDLDGFDVVLFSLHCFRDFYTVARMAHHKRKGQEWIAGGNACATPAPVGWIMDYVWVGDCRASFARILAGEREMEGMYDPRFPDRPVRYIDEDIDPEPILPEIIEISKGCPRRCLFCIHPWRHHYQEAPKEAVMEFVRRHPKKRLGLMSNSSDDVSFYKEISAVLAETGKQDRTVSNAVQSFSEAVAKQRTGDVLFGVEGASERLRWIVNKPIPRAVLHEKVNLCLRECARAQLVYQFNLPGEESSDFDEFEDDLRRLRVGNPKGQLAHTFIPSQPSAHTPFQWVVPRYSLATQSRIMDLRKSLIGSGKTGMNAYIGTPLGPKRWFAQVIAEWISITPAVAAAVEKLPQRAEVPEMVQALDARGVTLPRAFLHRDRDTVFPWSNVITTGDDADKWKRFAGMQRKLASDRFRGGPLPREYEAVVAEVASTPPKGGALCGDPGGSGR